MYSRLLLLLSDHIKKKICELL